MTIRPATIEDLEAIKQLNTDIFDQIDLEFDQDYITNFSFTPGGHQYFYTSITKPDGCFFVAEDNDRLIGYSNATVLKTPYWKSTYLEIENLGVLPGNQRQHIGSQLIDAVTGWAKSHGCHRLYLNCYIKNTNALDFYLHSGLDPIDISLTKVIE